MAKIEINIPTDDGEPLPEIHPDALTLMTLLEWARRRDFRIGPAIRIGAIECQVTDLRATTKGDNDPGAWQAAGYQEAE